MGSTGYVRLMEGQGGLGIYKGDTHQYEIGMYHFKLVSQVTATLRSPQLLPSKGSHRLIQPFTFKRTTDITISLYSTMSSQVRYANNQPAGFKNHIENVAIVGVSKGSTSYSCSMHN